MRATHAILVLLERIVDHDGNCSGEENFPSIRVFTKTVPLGGDAQFKLGEIIPLTYFSEWGFGQYETQRNLEGSGYCHKSDEWDDLQIHESAVSLLTAVGEIIYD